LKIVGMISAGVRRRCGVGGGGWGETGRDDKEVDGLRQPSGDVQRLTVVNHTQVHLWPVRTHVFT